MFRFLFKSLSSIKTSYIPALVFLVTLFMGTFYFRMSLTELNSYNLAFYIISFSSAFFTFFIQNKRSFLYQILLIMLYISANKSVPHTNFHNIQLWFLILVPINLILLFKLSSNIPVFGIFIFFLFEGVLIENRHLWLLPEYLPALTLISGIFWAGIFCYMLIKVSYTPDINDNAFFFSSLLILVALINYDLAPMRIFCLLGATITITLAAFLSFIYTYYKDPVTGVYSSNSFKMHDQKIFPPKYALSYIYIDNYNKILKVFGQKQTDFLTLMVLKRLSEIDLNAKIYRLKPNKFCFVFSDSDIKETYEQMEEVRRLIAGTEFVLPSKKSVKITVTPAVSEKRRSDSNAEAVLNRMDEMFYPRYRFTQNMTFCQELEKNKKGHRL